jgi:hypothetical protein
MEGRIEAKLAAFFEVAYALLEIRDRKLYRAEFKTFEDYCRIRWEFNRAHAYRLIGAAEVCRTLSPIGDIPLPENECQVRPLGGLPAKIVEKAWRSAYEKAGKDGKITGALVQKAVTEVTRKRHSKEEQAFKSNWQLHVEPLLRDAMRLTKGGDQDAVAEIIDKISLLLLVGRRVEVRGSAD